MPSDTKSEWSDEALTLAFNHHAAAKTFVGKDDANGIATLRELLRRLPRNSSQTAPGSAYPDTAIREKLREFSDLGQKRFLRSGNFGAGKTKHIFFRYHNDPSALKKAADKILERISETDHASATEPDRRNASDLTKNFNWTREELILALDLYFRLGRLPASKLNPDVVELSNFLKSLPLHPVEQRKPTFRNPAGVYSKLGNFLPYDPKYNGIGRPNGSHLDEVVWSEFANDIPKLRSAARAIREAAASLENVPEDEKDVGFSEGRLLTRIHMIRERNPEAARAKKAVVLRHQGRLACEVCDFDFKNRYGSLGDGFIECHHKKPLAELLNSAETKLDELALVCANCHRMLHRGSPILSIEELQSQLKPISSVVRNLPRAR